MKHLGDITKISGHEAPIVDCVIGGSPCQDLSIAGRRAGLAGERSGLYMEQIRIIKELREQDVQRNRANARTDLPIRPRYMVWENVPGAFSSNKGKDFAAVLEEAIRIAEPEAPDVPVPPKGWPTAGCIMGDGWSIAWRTHDAQFWGVPQRRKRISLVADFGGKSAPEILFESKSLPRDSEQSLEERKGPSSGTERSTSYAVRIRGGCDGGGKGALVQEEKSGTLGTGNDQTVFCFEPGSASRVGGHCYEDSCGSLRANMGDNQFAVAKNDTVFCIQGNCIDRADTAGCNGKGWREDQCYTLNTIDRPAVCCASFDGNKGSGAGNIGYAEEQAGTLTTGGIMHVLAIENHPADSRVKISDKDLCQALTGRMGTGGGNVPMVMCLNDQGGSVMGVSEDVTGALRAQEHGHQPAVFTKGTRPHNKDEAQKWNYADKANTLNAFDQGEARVNELVIQNNEPAVMTYATQSYSEIKESDVGASLKACGGVYGGGTENYSITKQSVRRLTPLECERLQGFPDNWTDIGEWIDSKGKKHDSSDSARYKALGNSIALPFWRFLCKRISAQYSRTATMASLFDGIGGFPLVWEKWNGKGSAVWASEIEEYPIAVTKYHFGEE